MTTPSPIDAHLAGFDEPQRTALLRTTGVIRRALPGAIEVISYGMPTFKVGGESGIAVMGLDGFSRHNSLFPYSGSVPSAFATELAGHVQTKGSIHFDRDAPFPAALLRRILKARIEEINASFPKKSGEYRQFHANGFPRVTGRLRDGQRRGTWITFDSKGAERTVTQY